MIEANQRTDITQRKSVPLGLGKRFAPPFPRSPAVALELLLRDLDGIADALADRFGWHTGSVLAKGQLVWPI